MAVKIALDAKLVDEVRALGINLSRACETGLAQANKQERERRWREEHADAIASSNVYVEQHDLPLAKYRMF